MKKQRIRKGWSLTTLSHLWWVPHFGEWLRDAEGFRHSTHRDMQTMRQAFKALNAATVSHPLIEWDLYNHNTGKSYKLRIT